MLKATYECFCEWAESETTQHFGRPRAGFQAVYPSGGLSDLILSGYPLLSGPNLKGLAVAKGKRYRITIEEIGDTSAGGIDMPGRTG